MGWRNVVLLLCFVASFNQCSSVATKDQGKAVEMLPGKTPAVSIDLPKHLFPPINADIINVRGKRGISVGSTLALYELILGNYEFATINFIRCEYNADLDYTFWRNNQKLPLVGTNLSPEPITISYGHLYYKAYGESDLSNFEELSKVTIFLKPNDKFQIKAYNTGTGVVVARAIVKGWKYQVD